MNDMSQARAVDEQTLSPAALLALFILGCTATGVALIYLSPFIIVGSVIGLVCIWITVKYPFYGLLMYLVFEYIRPAELVPALSAVHPTRLIVFFMAIGWLISRARGEGGKLVWAHQTTTVAVFTMVMAISVLTAVWPGRAAQATIDGLKTATVFLLMTNLINNEKRLKMVLWLLVMLAMWLGSESVIRHLATGKPGGVSEAGFLGDENDLALALLVILPITAALFQAGSQRQRMIAGAAFITIVFSVVFTFSRGGFIGLAFALLALGYVSEKRVVTVGTLAAFLAAIWIITPAAYHSRIATISQYSKDESAQGRILAWQAARAMFRDRPFFGVGPENFETAYGLYYKPPGAQAIWRAAHSIYFECIGELGTAGLASFALIVFFTLRTLNRIRRSNHALWYRKMAAGIAVGTMVYLVSGAFLSALYYPHLYFMAAISVILAQCAGISSGQSINPQEVNDNAVP